MNTFDCHSKQSRMNTFDHIREKFQIRIFCVFNFFLISEYLMLSSYRADISIPTTFVAICVVDSNVGAYLWIAIISRVLFQIHLKNQAPKSGLSCLDRSENRINRKNVKFTQIQISKQSQFREKYLQENIFRHIFSTQKYVFFFEKLDFFIFPPFRFVSFRFVFFFSVCFFSMKKC